MANITPAIHNFVEYFTNSGFSPTVSLILTIIIVVGLMILIYLFKDYIGNLIGNLFIKRREMKKLEQLEAEQGRIEEEQREAQMMQEQVREMEERKRNAVQYCMYCGTKIPPNSQFCMKCGREIPKNK